MARKWLKVAALGRRSSDASLDSDVCSASVADKGHFVVYTSEGKRFMVSLAYLHSSIFKELFKMVEDEYGLPGNGLITLPCDAAIMEYVLYLLRRRVPRDIERALLSSVLNHHSSACSVFHAQQTQQVVCSI